MMHVVHGADGVPPIFGPCPDIIRTCTDQLGLLIEEQVVTTKVRLLHLSMEILPRRKTPCIPTRANEVPNDLHLLVPIVM